MPDIKDYKEFLDEHKETLIICGGDGTLNFFINKTKDLNYKNDIFYYPCGSGNDFHKDLEQDASFPYQINDYLVNLPTVKVKDHEYKFLNGIGYGIDGYCCEVADEIKKKSTKPINYTAIAIKGLLFHFKPRNAKITVDDKEYKFKHVWLAPSMNGRYYGGGMKIAPEQDRLNDDGKLSVVVYHCFNNILALASFPSIFEGKHVEKTNMVKILTGHKIKVEFDKPCALQIDGETILNVKEYEVRGK